MRSQIWECIVACLKENGKYETPHKVHILGFGVPNAKNLAYGTPATNALMKLVVVYKYKKMLNQINK